MLVAAGTFSLSPLWAVTYRLWTTDPLRSIGAFFPLAACAGVFSAWRRLVWRGTGSIWALALVALSILLARVMPFIAFGYDNQGLINFGTVLFLYACGAVLLFGGPRLLRLSLAPLCLLLLINPVPHTFNRWVDLPLQYVSAVTARAFAHRIGLQPTGAQLRMMFTPNFGMFIAPGCDGVRGSITLGYLTLIFGYMRRLRPRRLLLSTLSAVLLGYALNLVRLCVLVLYYRTGLWFPSIQSYGTSIDYAIGGTLFVCAALVLGLLIRLAQPTERPTTEEALKASAPVLGGRLQNPDRSVLVRSLSFLALTFMFTMPPLRSFAPELLRPGELQLLASLPRSAGEYSLTRTWAEHRDDGRVMLVMGEYSAMRSPDRHPGNLTLGLWVGSANHLVVNSKSLQGTLPKSTGSFDATARQDLPVHFVTDFYDDGISRQCDAESTCSNSGCSDGSHAAASSGFFLRTARVSDLLHPHASRSLPILLRREWPDTDEAPPALLLARFQADARLFTAALDLRSLLLEDGTTQ